MLSKKTLAALAAVALVAICARATIAADPNGTTDTGSALKAPATSGPIAFQGAPIAPQTPPQTSVPSSTADQFEFNGGVSTLPSIFTKQWSTARQIPPESLISRHYIETSDTTARKMTLKEAVYVSLRGNPSIKAIQLNPVASLETVKQANGAFDPNLTSQIDVIKTVVPATSILQAGGSKDFATKLYDWNFGVNKLSAVTNGTMGIVFNNERQLTNSSFSSINPNYNPTLAISLSQPLLQNFGWKFATLSVRIAESGQKQAQWNYAQSLMDFVQRIGGEYWGVVLGEENLEVARAALKFNQDLVRQNSIAVKVGTLAPLDLQEAQSASATAEANVFTAEANLKTARAQLRQDVMYNPQETFLPAAIEPSDRPAPHEPVTADTEKSLETAVENLPSLAGMREAIRAALMQVQYSENQTLPSLTLGGQFGLTATAGTAKCFANPTGGFVPTQFNNCATATVPPSPPPNGIKLPFGGIYGDALNRLWDASFYNYAVVFGFQMPLDNAVPKAALAQARVQYEQSRMQYRASLSQAVVGVENAIANVVADQQRAFATEQATFYAKQALHDEEVRFRVGMATTHDLLQFQEEETTAEGNQVQAATDLENAKLNLAHAQGTILQMFNIEFQVQDPHDTPWYATF
ncbi:MAG TPA: TolC family protein [Candidatus Binataceae bacterium]|nr:TolC family protein [Candidatus Binataceae bacterium]